MLQLRQERAERWKLILIGVFVLCVMAYKITSIIGVEDSRFVGQGVKASVMFADDYDYLNKSIFYIRGDLGMQGYPFGNLPAGYVYPLVLSPWMLFDDPQTRTFVALAINVLLSGVAILFGILAVTRLTGRCTPLQMIALALFAPTFLMSFVVMTENLLFAVLAVLMWLVADFDATLRSRRRLVLLLVVLALAPLTRAPGLVVVPAMLLVVWVYRGRIGSGRPLLLAAAILVVTLGPYLIYAALAPKVGSQEGGVRRESVYLDILLDVARSPAQWATVMRFAWGQFCYLFVASAFWVIPVLGVLLLQSRLRRNEPDALRWRGFTAFLLTGAVGFVAFCMMHVLLKELRGHGSPIMYGRYNDPAVWLLVVGGIAALSVLKPASAVQAVLLRVVPPLLLCGTIITVYGPKWATVNQTGMAILAKGPPPVEYLVVFTVLATLLFQIEPASRVGRALLLSWFIAFQVATVDKGLDMVRARSKRIAHSLEAANWIDANVPRTSCIGFDVRVSHERAPHGFKGMWNVYRAMYFCVHPRPTLLAKTEEELGGGDYLYTTATADVSPAMSVAWTNGDYTLYQRVSNLPPAE